MIAGSERASSRPRYQCSRPRAFAVALLLVAAPAGAAPAPIPSDPTAAPSAARFEDGVSALDQQVTTMRRTPALLDGPGLRRAVLSLAEALENIPDARGVDIAHAARTLRDDFPDAMGDGPLGPKAATAPLRDALEVAAGSLLRLSRGAYAQAPDVVDQVDSFREAADAIDPGQSVTAQREPVLRALDRAGTALSSIEAASGVASVGAAEAQGVPGRAGAFSAALSNYSARVNGVASAAPERAPDALRRAFDALSDAIAVMPRGEGVVPSDRVTELHALAAEFQTAPLLSREQSRRARHLLDRAQAIFTAAGQGRFAGAHAVLRDARALREQVSVVDGSRPLRPQLGEVLRALEAAERVLRAMAMAAAR
jgi:hypothetical protein